MFYPRLTGRQSYDLNDVAEMISMRSSLSRADIVATLVSLEEIIPELLTSGYSIKLGELGTFSIQAKAQTSPEASQVTWRSFRSLITRFRAGKALKLRLFDVNFKKV
jgi:predicted histone-like DNA-binding protein